MIKALFALLFVSLFQTSALAAETGKAGGAPEGEGYELVSPPQPTGDPSKVEVIEFFWYGCPHCYHFEPELNAWLKTKPANVVFIRQPAVFNAHWAAHAKAYFTAEALGVVDKLHADFYDAIQNKKRTLESEDDLAKFFAEHGVKEEDFHKAYKSFAVHTKLGQAEGLAAHYGVTGTPALIVNGKYRIGGAQAKTFANMIAVTRKLIEKESAAAK
ncbi:thiol:disulfide interchange protein DsbA/DsbL [Methylococcus sp. EFPC2]|uniref:thiol:disulfide interchange protein DsbA/DsbL n=1 Tax=Methylococcus sp. EFPC2 TaxID=2812648 RepID=UPI0019673DB9|nr:thiol:disulfide interchange protein DsbA/DsbL [Methylococcus sp. EFPC2]QSA96663.1 thiol:disulfide interchange protein DsbA/DsbL [Methylococcus sp. EFPC2]